MSEMPVSPDGCYTVKVPKSNHVNDDNNDSELDTVLEIWTTKEPACFVCIIPRWTSNFFKDTIMIEFIEHDNQTIILTSPEENKIAAYNLKGEQIAISISLGDYVTGFKLVNKRRHLIVDSLIWHPIELINLFDVHAFLTTPEYKCIEIYEECMQPRPKISETHIEWSPRQKYTWDDFVSKNIEYQQETYRWDVFSATISDSLDDRVYIKRSQDVVGTIPQVLNNDGLWWCQFIKNPSQFQEKNGEETKSPLLVSFKNAKQLDVWSINGTLVAETSRLPKEETISYVTILDQFIIIVTSESRFLLYKISTLLDTKIEYSGKCVTTNTFNFSVSGPESIFFDTETVKLEELYNQGDLKALLSQRYTQMWNDLPYLRQLLISLSKGGDQDKKSSRFNLQFGGEQPIADSSINSVYQQWMKCEPISTKADTTKSEEMNDSLIQLISSIATQETFPIVKCFGTGSRIIMHQFRHALIHSKTWHQNDEPLSTYTAFFGTPPQSTLTDQLDMSVLIEEKLLIRFRMKQTPVEDSGRLYKYDPESTLELYISQVADKDE